MACHYTQEQLNEARLAYQRIATGQSVAVVIDQNGERIEFQRANIAALQALIREMELCLNADRAAAIRPLGVYL